MSNLVRLEDVATIECSGVDKKSKESEIAVKLCNYTDVYRNWAITKDMLSLFMRATANAKEIEKFRLKKGQVAITKDSETRDDIGVSAYIADDFENTLLGYHCTLITPNEGRLCGKYLNAFFNTSYAKKCFENKSSGSGQRYTLSIGMIGSLKIRLPSLKEQELVGNLFSEIDKKITNNHRIACELESLAKLIYDYWFLQFEFPNEEGKPYKSSGGKMIWNEELGREIPEGWGVEKLGAVVDTILGGTPDTEISEYWENGSINWLSSGEMANFPIVRADKKITPNAIQKSATKLMPKGTVALSITRYIRPTVLGIDSCANQSVVGILESETYKYPYLYPSIVNMVNTFLTLRTGAQQPHINKNTINNSLLLCPSKGVLDAYYQVVTPMYEHILNLATENQELAALRDWLLPLLMNGQVGFREAEQISQKP